MVHCRHGSDAGPNALFLLRALELSGENGRLAQAASSNYDYDIIRTSATNTGLKAGGALQAWQRWRPKHAVPAAPAGDLWLGAGAWRTQLPPILTIPSSGPL